MNNLFPTSWLDPYGSMPLNKEYSVQIDITQVETDDGIKVTAVKTPPHASTTSVQDAINMALGISCCSDQDKPTQEHGKPTQEWPGNGQKDRKQGQKKAEDGEDPESDGKKDKRNPDFHD